MAFVVLLAPVAYVYRDELSAMFSKKSKNDVQIFGDQLVKDVAVLKQYIRQGYTVQDDRVQTILARCKQLRKTIKQ